MGKSKDKGVVAIDIRTIPDGWDPEKWLKFCREHNTWFYDGAKGKEPISLSEEELVLVNVDSEVGMKIFKEMTNEKHENRRTQ